MRTIESGSDIGPIDEAMLVDPTPGPCDLTIVSVDDHVVEPPDMFQGRMPKGLQAQAPRVVELDDGSQAWYIDGAIEATLGLSAVAGRPSEKWNRDPIRFGEMRPGCWRIDDRVKDMDLNGIAASLCFPNSLMGFSGGKILRVRDDALGNAIVRAYNDWFYEEWYGKQKDRIVPCQLCWLRDVRSAVAEVVANAELGYRALSFSEDPSRLGLPSIWERYWDPLFRACEETGTAVCLHVGTASWNPGSYPQGMDNEHMPVVYFPTISLISTTEWLWSGVPTRFPDLKIVMAEGGVSWVPTLASRSDYVLQHSIGEKMAQAWQDELLPSEVLRRNFFFCSLDEPISPEVVEAVGVDHLLVESDYPHADGTWPHTQERLRERLSWMSKEAVQKATHLNAAKLFELPIERLKITASSDAGK